MVPPSKPAVKAFVPPQGLGRDEILARVRECLQTHTAITLEASEERQEDLIARGRHVLSAGDEEEEEDSARKQPRTEEEVVAPTTDNGAPPPEFLFEVSLAGDEVRVELVATTRGAASSAFGGWQKSCATTSCRTRASGGGEWLHPRAPIEEDLRMHQRGTQGLG